MTTRSRDRRRDALALLTPAEMARADAYAIAHGVGGAALMLAAGQAVARAIQDRWPARPTLILCGPGNNGGDGFVIAEALRLAGWPVRLSLLGERNALKGAAAHHAALWQGEIAPCSPQNIEGADLIVDALFGAGLARPITGVAADTLVAAARAGVPIVAVDVPSGLDGATGEVRGVAVRADLTVTFFRKKPGHLLLPGRALCGDTIVADIGIADAALDEMPDIETHENAPGLWLDAFPWPDLTANKYSRGHVLVWGGETMTGAARLAARAAGRAGAGLVTLAAPRQSWAVYASALSNAIVLPMDGIEDFRALLADPRRNAILLGPGGGVTPVLREAVLGALGSRKAVVLDADALTAFKDAPERLFSAVAGPVVLTPHEGEFQRLFRGMRADKLARARAAAERSHAVVVLKGPDTVIAAPDGRAAINANAPPELATGGTGDVLAGLVTGLLAQGMPPFEAAMASVWMHGEAAQAVGPGLVADDLLDVLPGVLRGVQGLARDSLRLGPVTDRLYREKA